MQWNTGLGSLFDLGTVPEQLHADHYRALLRSAPPGVFELMVHPAASAGELDGLTRIGAISEREWRLLRATDMRALAAEQRAVSFFDAMVRQAATDDIRRAAEEMRNEEVEHVALVQAWLQKVPKPGAEWAVDPDPPRYD